MPTEVLGIDFSGDVTRWKPGCRKSNVWIATGTLRNGELRIANLVRAQDLRGPREPFLRLSQTLNTKHLAYAAIDAPFSVPHSLSSDAEALWRRVDSLPKEGRPFARGRRLVETLMPECGRHGEKIMRETEALWRARGVNVRSTLWCGPRGGAAFAVACMTLLAAHKGPVWPFRKNGEQGCVLAEAFPAA